MNTIEFEERTIPLFKAAYERAVKNKRKDFMFQDNIIQVKYAESMLEFMEAALKPKTK